jgi:hypothetical protein
MAKNVDERYSNAAEFAAAARAAAEHRDTHESLCPATNDELTVLAPKPQQIGIFPSVRQRLLAIGLPASATRTNIVGRAAVGISVIGIIVALVLGAIAIAVRSSPTASLVLKIVCLSIDLALQPIAGILGIAGLSRPEKGSSSVVALCLSLVATIGGAVTAARLLLETLASN